MKKNEYELKITFIHPNERREYFRDKEWNKDNDFKLSKPLIWSDSLQMRIYKNEVYSTFTQDTVRPNMGVPT